MRTLIFLGGEKPSSTLAREAAGRAGFIIAADSGYLPAIQNGITPDIVTGDFDSIGEPPDLDPHRIIHAPQQDATDFEKALRHIPANNSTVEILGGTGLRSDHFLTNLLIAAGLPPGQRVIFEDDTQTIFRVTPHCPLDTTMDPQRVLSLIPFSHCTGVSTNGLHWNLQSAKMGPRDQLGQSNRIDRPSVSVKIEAGTLYVVLNKC